MADTSPQLLLFVCTGNTCRSPMAECLMAHLCRGVPGWRFASAGVCAAPGRPASAHAIAALREKGLDLSSHRSRPLSASLIREAAQVVALSRDHRNAVLSLAPEAAPKTRTLHSYGSAKPEGDVLDPVGGSLETYRRTRDEIESALTDLILALVGPPLPSTPSHQSQEHS